ncbi:Imm45 family immunity protein [Herbaspirillum huttiense]|uniref:Imm45 family immunity protein n=1 Tax=Herbaspirillum huttiense TaxID=863372 RepID=UPI003819FF56
MKNSLIRWLQNSSQVSRAISKDWLIRKWDEWVYPQCAIEDVLVARRYEVESCSR